MLDVFFTFDVEVWCDGWSDIDAKFPDAFRRYIYGSTSRGDYGLPYELKVLGEHGLRGVFFVEPLFAARFGLQPLAEIVDLIESSGHDIELHLHTEWVDEARTPLLPNSSGKRQHLRYFSREEQEALVAAGIRLLTDAGAPDPAAFRAGSFALNADTLPALRANMIRFDSSYNASTFGPDSGLAPGRPLLDATLIDDVWEYPMTVFSDGLSHLRHAQLGACSFGEFEGLLWRALEVGRRSFVILAHNFELLNAAKNHRDEIVARRFRKLCAFLDRHRDKFNVRGFRDLLPVSGASSIPLESPLWRSGLRTVEQLYRRRYE